MTYFPFLMSDDDGGFSDSIFSARCISGSFQRKNFLFIFFSKVKDAVTTTDCKKLVSDGQAV